MAGSTSVALLRDIQTLFDAGTAAGLSDRQLLERFAGHRDATAEAAFEVLVLRHGPMVLRVCRNVLPDPNDVQDAFQATFLVLVRRRGAVRHLESLGGWLYGVAHRVAVRARVETARRRAVEQRAALRVVEAFEPSTPLETEFEEFGASVQEEVRRLPEKYRGPVVLCYWQGLTHEQAAVQLGIPLGTVRSRVARARDLLRRRLTRRGLAPLSGVVGAGLDGPSAMVPRLDPVPAGLFQATIRAAVGQASGQVVTGVVASLVQRVLWSMTMIKIGGIAAGAVLLGLAGFGVGIAGQEPGPDRTDRQVSQDASGPTAPQGKVAPANPPSGKKSGGARSAARDPARKGTPFVGVYSDVRGQTTIMKILPEGSVVKKGEIVCELDSAALRDQLINQRITTESAKANFQNAKLRREEAELVLGQYRDDLLPREQRELEAEVKVAESELDLAEEEQKEIARHEQSPIMLKRASVPVARARLTLEKVKNRLHILTVYTKHQRIKEFQSEVEKAHSNELAKQATAELEKSKEAKLERQIAACTLIAPIDGTVVYPRYVSAPNGALVPAGRTSVPIEIGASVRERQLLFQIVPTPGADPEAR
jgi:HlyD family secretion protein